LKKIHNTLDREENGKRKMETGDRRPEAGGWKAGRQ